MAKKEVESPFGAKSLDDAYDDFGFTFVSASDIAEANNLQPKSTSQNLQKEVDTLQKKYEEDLDKLEHLMIPLLNNLLKSPEQEYILWKNREKPIRDQIDKILKITRQFHPNL